MPSFSSWLGATFMLSSPRLLRVFTYEISTQTLAKKCDKNTNIKMKWIAYAQVWSGSSLLGRPHAIFLSLQNKHARLNLFCAPAFFGTCGLGGGAIDWGWGGTNTTFCLTGTGADRRRLDDGKCGLKFISKSESDEGISFRFVLVEVCWTLGLEGVIGVFEIFDSARLSSDR